MINRSPYNISRTNLHILSKTSGLGASVLNLVCNKEEKLFDWMFELTFQWPNPEVIAVVSAQSSRVKT